MSVLRHAVAAVLAAASLYLAGPVFACSPMPGYRVPGNLELVDQADLILLGRVEGAARSRDGWERRLRVRPVAALKGVKPGGTILVPGAIGRPIRSDPYELEAAHPESYAGACNRYSFRQGGLVLFFLRRAGDQWHLSGGAFTRLAEDVSSADAPWTRLVRFYVRVLSLPEKERRAALVTERDRLRAQPADRAAAVMAADIDRQLQRETR